MRVGSLRHLDPRVAVAPAARGRRRNGGSGRGGGGGGGGRVALLLLLVVVHELRSGRGEPLAERGLLLEHSLNVGVTRRLLQLLAVHPVPECIHHTNLEGVQRES